MMKELDILIKKMARCKHAGHSGLFTLAELALMLDRPAGTKFNRWLASNLDKSLLARVTRGIYMSKVTPPDGIGVLEQLARILHNFNFIYISLESELSRLGIISQVQQGWLTVMTTGRSGIRKTSFGTIEFTHTKKDIKDIKSQLYFDAAYGVFRATPELAIRDLKRVGRNLHMLEGSGYAESFSE